MRGGFKEMLIASPTDGSVVNLTASGTGLYGGVEINIYDLEKPASGLEVLGFNLGGSIAYNTPGFGGRVGSTITTQTPFEFVDEWDKFWQVMTTPIASGAE